MGTLTTAHGWQFTLWISLATWQGVYKKSKKDVSHCYSYFYTNFIQIRIVWWRLWLTKTAVLVYRIFNIIRQLPPLKLIGYSIFVEQHNIIKLYQSLKTLTAVQPSGELHYQPIVLTRPTAR